MSGESGKTAITVIGEDVRLGLTSVAIEEEAMSEYVEFAPNAIGMRAKSV